MLFERARRSGLARAVIVVAALATIATCKRPGWDLAASLVAIPDPTKATLVVVEASEQPGVTLGPDSKRLVALDGPPQRPGTWSYLVPRGATLKWVGISGRCGSGMCSAGCPTPAGAFVRIASATAVESWKLETTSAPVTTVLAPDKDGPYFRVKLSTSRAAAVTVDMTGTIRKPAVWGDGTEYKVSWPSYPTAGTDTATWTVRAVIEGPCPSAAPCSPPPQERVLIISVSEDKARP